MGLAFDGEHTLYSSEGNSGRIRVLNPTDGSRKRILDLNRDGFSDSFTSDLAFDPERRLLYALDQANFRLVVVDVTRRQIAASLRLGRLPFALALSPDEQPRCPDTTTSECSNAADLARASSRQARDTGLPFPAFGFPSNEAVEGVRRATAKGEVQVPGLGDPNAQESNSLAVVNLENPSCPRIRSFHPHRPAVWKRNPRRQQPLWRDRDGRSHLRVERPQRFHHRHRRQDESGHGGNSHSDTGLGKSMACQADRVSAFHAEMG